MVRLWKFFLEDNLNAFRQSLTDVDSVGSPGYDATHHRDGKAWVKSRKSLGYNKKSNGPLGRHQDITKTGLSPGDINARDALGRTLLHHAASSTNDNAYGFIEALLQIPVVDLYVQDFENGWTPLHRALYHGHIRVAQALMFQDMQNLTNFTHSTSHQNRGSLIKVKDHEGNSPFEVFSLTVSPRDLQHLAHTRSALNSGEEGDSVDSSDAADSDGGAGPDLLRFSPTTNLLGDGVLVFGSNKNLNLGLGDEDDRQFAEQVILQRPEKVLLRLQAEARIFDESREGNGRNVSAVISHKQIIVQDVVMSKLHTAIITDDPEANIHVCGFGPGGRLGTGDETTRFSYVCLQTGALSQRRVVVAALGQDHSIVVCAGGEVFSWGSNKHSQLGYSISSSASGSTETPKQLSPRQVFGNIKKEAVVGAAASSLHSAIFTSSALYTFGKNEGQLGLMDADARSLEYQITPRRIGVSIIQVPIVMVAAIDRATTVLLETHEVIVFTHYGWTKVNFPVEGFSGFFRPKVHSEVSISKITSAGNTICALSTLGDIFTVNVSQKADPTISQSTTNPSKARNALPLPAKIWNVGKPHMAARDVALGQDGTIILCTVSGSVWRKEKRIRLKERDSSDTKIRNGDYKFTRIQNITHAVGVRSNAYGAYAAIRSEPDLMREQICIDPPSIWDVFMAMLPLRQLISSEDGNIGDSDRYRFWTSRQANVSPAQIKEVILSNELETRIRGCGPQGGTLDGSEYDIWVSTTLLDVKIPIHSFLLGARSEILRNALATFAESYYFTIPDILSLEYGADGHICLNFHGADVITVLSVILYFYTEEIVNVWHHIQKRPSMASRYRQVRLELMRIGKSLDMPNLESAVRVMTEPAKRLHLDMETAFLDPTFFVNTDVLIELAHDSHVLAHSALLKRRCPFFEGLFAGRAQGMWLSTRREQQAGSSDPVKVDLKHFARSTFEMVLRHIYADTGAELFDKVVCPNVDDFIDVIIDVMAASNELMLDRLAQICQRSLGQYVTTRNICHILNAVAPCSVDQFKRAGLEYICLNLETMLEHRLLEELDPDLLEELDEIVQNNQQTYLPSRRDDWPDADLVERYPEIPGQIRESKQRLIDSVRLRSRALNEELRQGMAKSYEEASNMPEPDVSSGPSYVAKYDPHGATSGHDTQVEANKPVLMFDMDDDEQTTVSTNDLGDGALQASTRQFKQSQMQHLNPRPEITLSEVPDASGGGFRSMHRLQSPLPTEEGHTLASSETPAIGKAWHLSTSGSLKADFRDIMEQTPSARNQKARLILEKSDMQQAKTPPKISQKQRKRIQSQIARETSNPPRQSDPTDPVDHAVSSSPQSPWKALNREAKASPPQIHVPPTSQPPSGQPRQPMTMRQTLAGGSTPANINRLPIQRDPTQLSSSPNQTRLSNSPPQIRSIRHVSSSASPVPNSPPKGYYSMADILAQQLGEKVALKDAIAKRSLMEIQQEQEFQEWWDSESKRVQEEEVGIAAEARRGLSGSPSSGRGRGRGSSPRSRGRGAGGKKTSSNSPAGSPSASASRPVPGEVAGHQHESARRGNPGQPRGRGSGGRGRGRGGDQGQQRGR